jgi:hypothetical protein
LLPVRHRIAQRPLPWLSAALFLANAAIVWRLFHTEYVSQTGTVEGVFIAYARYARDHWPDLDWCRIWYAGLPFPNAYEPALHLTVAAVSAVGHVSAGSAFHFVVALLYCLGPVTLFWMAFRLTHSASWSFYAGLLYSLISPSAFLVGEIRRDLGSVFFAQRLHTVVGYADSPHVSSLTLIPLAILALDWALEKRRPIYYVAAALALAAVPLTNWPGTIVLAFAVIAYGLSLGWGNRLRGWVLITAIGALGYGFAIPWAPPSTILTTVADTQTFELVNEFGSHHLVYGAVLIVCTLILLRVFSAVGIPGYLRFFLLFFFYMAAITLAYYWLGVTLLAQPHRFHLAMEMGCILSLVFVARLLLPRSPALRKPVAAAFAIVCVVQFVHYRNYSRELVRAIDMTKTSEYKTARWFDEHMRDSRVMVPGSTDFWLNAFTDTPQLAGCCPQGVLSQTIPIAIYGMYTDLTAESRAAENSLLWLKALGVRAVAVSGPRSTEVYKPFYHPHKFEGRLPVLWREEDDVIYEVPEPSYSLAHAVEPSDLVERSPVNGVDTAPLIPYVAAIEFPGSALQMRWLDNETAVISGNLKPGQLVSVQVPAHPGWHATVAHAPRRVFADKLGFLVIDPNCSGDCTINLHYDGGIEMQSARWIRRIVIVGSLLWVVAGFTSRRWRSGLPAISIRSVS